MAAEQTQTTAGRPVSRGTLVKFWIGLVVAVIVVVTAGVVGLRWATNDRDEAVQELNDRYVEKIDLRSVSRGSRGRDELVVIDGRTRYDCSEEGGWLTCSDDPQPTRE